METETLDLARQAVSRLPRATYVLTAAHEDKRSGILVHWVQPASEEPLLVSAAVRKGHSIEPLIRDSHSFAINRISPDDKLLLRKFSGHDAPDEMGDPFDAIQVVNLRSGSPGIRRAYLILDCMVIRHFDLEADHELYIGQVIDARVND